MLKTLLLTVSALCFLSASALANDMPAKDTTTEKAVEAPAKTDKPNAEAAPAPKEGGHHLKQVDWSFNGPFGTYDRAALQRGFQVYRQVCSACHALDKMYYRHLGALGYSDAQIKTIAADATIQDGPNDEGEMFDRPGRPSDKIKKPFPNDKAAMFANNGALPPDLSLIAKARHGGADYIYSILTGYEEPPAGVTLMPGQHYNEAKDGHIIAMAPPLVSDGQIAYEDAATPQTVDQYAKDVSQFLTWAAEPEMEQRKRMGVKVVVFLMMFAAVMYGVKKKIWSNIH